MQNINKKNANNCNTNTNDQQTNQPTYIQGTTARITRILQKHNIKTAFKPHTTVGSLLRSLKDQIHHEH